ncbi:MAG: hypothetical protein AAF514_11095 [Verrucomicrobiota bacterium]
MFTLTYWLSAGLLSVRAVEPADLDLEVRFLRAAPTLAPAAIAPYRRALTADLFEVVKVHGGSFAGHEILVLRWSIWDGREVLGGMDGQATGRIQPVPWAGQKGLRAERIFVGPKDVERMLYYNPGSRPAGRGSGGGGKTPVAWLESEALNAVLPGKTKGWLFLKREVEHAAAGEFWKEDWKPGGVVLDFRDQLDALGIELLLVPIPTKVSLAGDHLDENLEPGPIGFATWMKKEGIEVLDLEPVFCRARDEGKQVYCASDSHWTPVACRLAAAAIRSRVEKQPWWKDLKPEEGRFRTGVPSLREIDGDLSLRLKATREHQSETVMAQEIVAGNGRPIELAQPESPFILLGDSHTLVFSEGSEELHGRGAGLPDGLALELGRPVDVVANRGSGSHGARINLYQSRSRNPRHPDYWKNKKLLIWCFSVREFTGVGPWEKLPVARRRK